LALTSIGRDHEQILGSTPLQVCKEKLAATGQDTAIFVSSQLNADAKTSANLKKWIQSESGYLNTKHFVLADADLHQTPMQANLELATAVRNFVLSNHELDQREQQTHCFQFYGRNMSVTPSRAMQEQHPSVVSVHLDVCHNIDALKTSIDSLLTGEAILFYSCLQDKFSADILHALQQAKVPFALFASGPKNRALLPECIANHPDVNFFASMEEGLASAWFQKESSNGKDLKLCVWGSFFGIEDFLRMEPSAIKSVKQSSSAGAKL
jgi:folylpolyglutamate synthase/dihydropteroate synthase